MKDYIKSLGTLLGLFWMAVGFTSVLGMISLGYIAGRSDGLRTGFEVGYRAGVDNTIEGREL